VGVATFWALVLLPLREQVSDGHSSDSLQDADSTLENRKGTATEKMFAVFPRCSHSQNR
jgi:hypothetical protein